MPDSPARRARPPQILVLEMGPANPQVHEQIGGYSDWFRRQLEPRGAQITPVAVHDSEVLPYGGRYDGIILSGSACGVRDQLPWMNITGRWAVAMAAHTPVLGVCFGHQLIGEALGGRVEPHPDGPEWGTFDLALTEEGRKDPLFEGLPEVLQVQQLHRDLVIREPDPHRFTRLAGNAHTPLQAYAVGPWLRAVQFHPELSDADLDVILKARDWAPTAPLRPSDHGSRILANWLRSYVLRAG